MRLNNDKISGPVEVVGGGQTSSFSIAMNGKAFKVLSDTMYKDKIGSIVREISCNAYDAHISAGKADVPFEVHLPDPFEPWFAVKDFGIGLSEDDIRSVFTVYFQSTKDNSNDVIGAFGLGAKTPFSYTDQFTVTSVKDGVQTIYSAYITESGVPDCVKMGQSETDASNGVEIHMSVKREDFHAFKTALKDQLRYFPVKPIVNNASNFAFDSLPTNVLFKNDDITVYDERHSYYSAGHSQVILQGNVGYPLDHNEIRSSLSDDAINVLDMLRNWHFAINFNIGEIGVIASREGVEYNKPTIANIEKKLLSIRTYLEHYVAAELAQIDTAWDRAVFLNENSFLKLVANSIKFDLGVPGIDNNGSNYNVDLSYIAKDPKPTIDKWGGKVHARRADIRKRMRSALNAIKNMSDIHYVKNNVVFVIKDVSNRTKLRAEQFFAENRDIQDFIEIDLEDKSPKNIYKYMQWLGRVIGGYKNIIKMSDIVLPKVVTASGKKRSYSRPTMYAMNESVYIREWDRVFDDFEDFEYNENVAYILIKNMQPITENDLTLIKDIQAVSKYSDSAKNVTIVGIRENDEKKLDGLNDYVKIADFHATIVSELKDVAGEVAYKLKHRIINAQIHNSVPDIMIEKSDDFIAGLKSGHKIKRLFERAKNCDDSEEFNYNDADRLLNLVKYNGFTTIAEFRRRYENKTADVCKSLLQPYEFLSLLGGYWSRNQVSVPHIVNYLNCM